MSRATDLAPASSAGDVPAAVAVRGGELSVDWPDGATATIAGLTTRDACDCPDCRVAPGGQRLFETTSISLDERLVSAQIVGDGVAVHFSGGHQGWLAPATARRLAGGPGTHPPRWGAEYAAAVRPDAPRDYTAAMRRLLSHGLAMVTGLPAVEGTVLEAARELGHVRDTNYGRSFDVRAVVDPGNLAYSSLGLSVHTDNPYRDPVPTVQLLHCVRSSSNGGESVFVDGFRAAEELARIDPGAYELLTTTLVRFRYADGETDLEAAHPMIELDPAGRIVAMRVNNRSMQPVTDGDVGEFYRAYQRLTAVLDDPAAGAHVLLQPGELVAFDNRRVLHGRTGYTDVGSRLLQGCYIDIDEVASRVRVADRAVG